MKNILITGGAGFCGKNLIKALLQYDNINKIIVVDNFISSTKQDFNDFVQRQESSNINIELYDHDITTNMDFIKKHILLDEIYHFASIASPPLYKKYQLDTLDSGYIGTKNVLEIATYQSIYFNKNVKVLYTSTSEVYGDPNNNLPVQNENYYGNVNSFGERSCYDESKRIGETLCYTFIKKYNLNIKIARLFNTYGPEMMINDGRIITETIKALIYNTPLNIYGDGTQTRSLCYVSDTIEMLIKLMNSDCNTPINIGNNKELSINEIVDIIEQLYNKCTNSKYLLKKNYIKLTQNDPLKRCPCLIKNEQVLGVQNYTTLKNGLKNTINFFLNKLIK